MAEFTSGEGRFPGVIGYPCGLPIGTERAAGEVGKGTATMSDDKDRDEDVISTRQYIQSLRRLQSNRVEPAPASAVADADSLSSGGFSARNRMRDSARTSSNESSPEKMKTLGRWDKLVEDDGGEEMDQETAEKHLFGSIEAPRPDVGARAVGLVPLSTFMRRWDMLTMWLLLYTAIWTPFEVAFVEEKRCRPCLREQVINPRCTDMIINFNPRYRREAAHDDLGPEVDRETVLAGFFIIDFYPFYPTTTSHSPGGKANLKILRCEDRSPRKLLEFSIEHLCEV